ncbi:hypothetical protein [Mycolicibacterium canariasense]|uniref:hypothetical protein n=1 Tax=Mycolicibacterium canariasense TaxID=228230 RepID=UPI000A162078|nr:hypothetical protein [Mycolicibacterium canariasense]MCV7208409.1 MFS transporter [Mycolicibacterium canariasense]ORV13588.1 hypothetical protein AWB94_05055 [Mycolicibacterium canariasense]
MSHIKIEVDGNIVMDAEVSPRRGELPSLDDIQGSLKKAAGGTFQPWAVCAIQALALAMQPMLVGKPTGDTTIAVTTRAGGWALDVSET